MEKFDVVIIGGGHNGITTAAYLAKAGLKVVLAESRMELGGGMDFAEPIPGFHIQPHAGGLYARAAPGFDQLELWKYGFRLAHWKDSFALITSDARGLAVLSNVLDPESYRRDLEELRKWSKRDAEAWGHLFEGLHPIVNDFLTSVFYTPPWPREVDEEADPLDLPWVQVFKKGMGNRFSRDWIDMNFSEVIDSYLENEPLKAFMAFVTYLKLGCPPLGGDCHPNEAPRYKANDPWVNKSLMTVVGFENVDELLAYWNGVISGDIGETIGGHITCESLFDPTLARVPPNFISATLDPSTLAKRAQHVAFFQINAPYDLKGSWEGRTKDIQGKLLEKWRQYAPNMTEENVAMSQIETPVDIERRLPSMRKGSIKHGDYSVIQMGKDRNAMQH